MSEEQFLALERWVIAVASHCAAEFAAPGFSDDGRIMQARRDEAKALLVPLPPESTQP